LVPVIRRFRLSFDHFDQLIRGVEMDLERSRYETFAELETYCYRVASVVGLLSIEIFGYQNPSCRDYAIALGKALQFTNILRDVRNDAERGRIYLPGETLDRFRVDPEEILRFEWSERFAAMAADFAARARSFYAVARRCLPAEDRRSMAAAELMGTVYWRLLRKLEAGGFRVFGTHTTRVSKLVKVMLILQMWFRMSLRVPTRDYGTA
jgi:phytoene synthase